MQQQKHYEPSKIIYSKARHIFKSCNIYLKTEHFRKSKFTLSKIKSESVKIKMSKQYIQAFTL